MSGHAGDVSGAWVANWNGRELSRQPRFFAMHDVSTPQYRGSRLKKSRAAPIRQTGQPFPLVSRNCIRARSHKLFSMERQVTAPIDAVFPRVVLNRTVDGSLPRLFKAAGQ
ncbi:hypothetical protein [Paraburkholderia fungorum]|uniref:hypothetical protein n=1 Tax=Paraburkholderia fungorum TaxID=134537 RepID=UPI0011EA6E2C